MRIELTGHGAGGRETKGRPNVLRLIVGEEAAGAERGPGPRARDRARRRRRRSSSARSSTACSAQGALDAFFTPVQMKKGRPGVLVTVIAEPAKREALEELLFRETTTLGVRRQVWDRTVLERETARGRDRLRADPCQDRPPGRDDLQRVARVRRLPAGGRREGRGGEGGPRRRPRRVARGRTLGADEHLQARFGHHDADLLRQRRAARRPRLHDDRGRHARARAAPRGPGRLLPDRHRRARAEHRADRARAGHLRAGALRRHLGGVPLAVGAGTTSATTASSGRPRTSTAGAS